MSRPKRAVALSFDPTKMNAPQVCARGARRTAEELVRRARRYGVPVVKNAKLLEQLDPLQIEEEIPNSLYPDVAALFVELSRRD